MNFSKYLINYICFVCVKETSYVDVSFTHKNICLIGKKADYNLLFWREGVYILMSSSLDISILRNKISSP